jgi:hypothetical protein
MLVLEYCKRKYDVTFFIEQQKNVIKKKGKMWPVQYIYINMLNGNSKKQFLGACPARMNIHRYIGS